MLAPAHEAGVNAERDVVQEQAAVGATDVDAALLAVHESVERTDWVVAVEADVAREVVACAERDAHERQPSLQGDLNHDRERTVAACDPERVRVCSPGELRDVVALPEHVHADTACLRLAHELLGRAAVTRVRIDDEVPGHRAPIPGRGGC